MKRRNDNWVGQIFRVKCLLKHVIEGKMQDIRDEKTRKKT